MSKALPLRVQFAEDEAPYSLLARLAVRHGCGSIIEFLGQLQRAPTNFQRLVYSGYHAEHVARLAGQPAALVVRNAIHPSGGHLSVRGERIIEGAVPAGRLKAGRVCTLCLSDDLKGRPGPIDCRPYRRFWWDLTALHMCPLHSVKLLADCPHCHKPLRRYSMSPRFCPCGLDLAIRAVPVLHAPSMGQSYLLARLAVGERSTHATLDQLPWDIAAQAIDYFGRAWQRTGSDSRVATTARGAARNVAEDNAFSVTKTSTDGFAALLRILGRNSAPSDSPMRVYAPLWDWLRRSKQKGLEPLRHILREETARQFALADRLRGRLIPVSPRQIRFSTAALRIGVSVPRLRNLFVEFGYSRDRAEARTVRSVPVEACARISRALASSVLTVEAAAILDIRVSEIRHLVASNALKLASRRGARGLLRIDRRSLERFRQAAELKAN